MLPSLSSVPKGVPHGSAHEQVPSTRPKPRCVPLPRLQPCSSLVQIGKNRAAPAPSQRAPGPGSSPGKDSRELAEPPNLLWGAA